MHGAALEADTITRTPLRNDEAYSGASIERIVLASGRVVVLKHLPADGDWLTRATDGLGRTRLLWDSGLLRRLTPAVAHGTIDVIRDGDHDVVVMDDLSSSLWPHPVALDRSMTRDAMVRLCRFHHLGEQLVARYGFEDLRLCEIGARYGMFRPRFLVADDGPNQHPARDTMLEGWELFAEHGDPDIVAAVRAVHADPLAFGRNIEARCTRSTILHGDAKPENLGVAGDRMAAIDWGELTGLGPREVDVAWFALMSARSHDTDPGDVFAFYEHSAGAALDPLLLDLVCIGSLAQMAFRLTRVAHRASKPGTRHRAAELLRWWTDRVRVALDRGNAPVGVAP